MKNTPFTFTSFACNKLLPGAAFANLFIKEFK
jgi:hypothetical protein